MQRDPMTLSRRSLLAAAGAAGPAILHWPADAAEFAYRCGTALPDAHPMSIRGREAMQAIREASNGRLAITLYTNSMLGQGPAMIAQTIAGKLDMYYLPLDLLGPKNPAFGIFGVGFLFADYEHIWPAMDGALGDHLRSLAGRVGFRVVHNCYDHGFREITSRQKPIKTPADLDGFRIRMPVAPILIALFQHLGAAPVPIDIGKTYHALQSGRVDGQENPLVLIDAGKLYEVQTFCSITNHVWAGIHVSFGNAAWARLPSELQRLADREFNAKALLERADWQSLTAIETESLKKKGMIFNSPDIEPFREELKKSGFYPEMKRQSGEEAWALLEKYVGPLA
ncbi:MAG TPA: TRAP transporter substrate-binding protein [Stellaceae bacterium]